MPCSRPSIHNETAYLVDHSRMTTCPAFDSPREQPCPDRSWRPFLDLRALVRIYLAFSRCAIRDRLTLPSIGTRAVELRRIRPANLISPTYLEPVAV